VDEPAGWRSIDELAALVGHYCWIEGRLFGLTGGWASAPTAFGAPDATGAASNGRRDEFRVWCAAASRRHGELAARWTGRLPVRAGVDAGALIVAPSSALAGAFDVLEAEADLGQGVAALVGAVLPWLDRTYERHAAVAPTVSEAPVLEVLMEARRVVGGEIRGGGTLLGNAGEESPVTSRTIMTILGQALEEISVLPAVHPS
jgi:hypothetical protein